MKHIIRSSVVLTVLASAFVFSCKGSNSPGGSGDGDGDTGGSHDGTGDGDGDTGGNTGDGDGDTGGNTGDGDGDGDGAPGGQGGLGGMTGDGDSFECPDDSAADPRIDGLLQAVRDLTLRLETAESDFEDSITALETAWSLSPSGNLTGRTNTLITNIDSQVSAGNSGPLWIYFPEVECTSDRDAAESAFLDCEGTVCDAMSESPLSVTCAGWCLGACEGTCEGTEMCRTQVTDAPCTGECTGSCVDEVGATCDALCTGSCSGSCLETDGEGACAGHCDGMCDGSCSLPDGNTCAGSCTGSCVEAKVDACAEETLCEGECSGTCAGDCAGSVQAIPRFECAAADGCVAQASAWGDANIACSSPEVLFTPKYAGPAVGKAGFTARMNALKAQLPAIRDAGAFLDVVLQGEVNGTPRWEDAPVVELLDVLQAVRNSGPDGIYFSSMPPEQISCAQGHLDLALSDLTKALAESTTVAQAVAAFLAAAENGFN